MSFHKSILKLDHFKNHNNKVHSAREIINGYFDLDNFELIFDKNAYCISGDPLRFMFFGLNPKEAKSELCIVVYQSNWDMIKHTHKDHPSESPFQQYVLLEISSHNFRFHNDEKQINIIKVPSNKYLTDLIDHRDEIIIRKVFYSRCHKLFAHNQLKPNKLEYAFNFTSDYNSEQLEYYQDKGFILTQEYARKSYTDCKLICCDKKNEFWTQSGLLVEYSNYIKGVLENRPYQQESKGGLDDDNTISIDLSHLEHVSSVVIITTLKYISRKLFNIKSSDTYFIMGLIELSDYLGIESVRKIADKLASNIFPLHMKHLPIAYNVLIFAQKYNLTEYKNLIRKFVVHIKKKGNITIYDSIQSDQVKRDLLIKAFSSYS